MSADAISFSMRARSFGSARSAVTLFLLRLNRRKEAGARADQRARLVAARRLDLDHLGAEIAEDHAAGRPHHHVGEFDHADAAERQARDAVRGIRCGPGALFALAALSRRRRAFAARSAVFAVRAAISSSSSACARASARRRGIEADIDHVGVEHGAARHREGQVLLDMHERHRGLSGRNRDRQPVELADDRSSGPAPPAPRRCAAACRPGPGRRPARAARGPARRPSWSSRRRAPRIRAPVCPMRDLIARGHRRRLRCPAW